jgi:hypothetical protein
MPETFLILLAGGIMLAAAISDPRAVTLHWLRLAGILALCGVGLAMYFLFRKGNELVLILAFMGIAAQLAFAQSAWRQTQRAVALLSFVICLTAGVLIVQSLSNRGSVFLQIISCAGISAACGTALMDMLLGHAYLTAAKMTIAPFRRLNLTLAVVLGYRAILSIPVVFLLQSRHPIEQLWNIYGLYAGTRWLVGLIVPGVFVFMAHDCVKRRSTQSATGILYVAGVLIFIGEIIALYLLVQTGLPF